MDAKLTYNMALKMMRGLPASGKSTRAKEIMEGGNWYRVNRDLLRTMLHFDKFTGRNEEVTINLQKLVVASMLSEGKNVIVDDTNLGQSHEDQWRLMAEMYNTTFEVVDMKTPFRVSIERNKGRLGGVPESVIRNMALQYGLFEAMRNIVIVDIDGTVADCTHRQHFVQNVQKKDWKGFFSQLHLDTPRKEVYEDACEVARENDAEIVFVSARPEDYREGTERWLRDNKMDYIALVMRRKGDSRPDTDVKRDIYNRYLKQYDVVKVFDDRPAVIRMWEAEGLDVEDVGNGEEF